MTGPEHYTAAERFLLEAHRTDTESRDYQDADQDAITQEVAALTAAAQAHAILALTAATVNAYHSVDPEQILDRIDWSEVLT